MMKKLIVVLGMHRSGTSTFARALRVMNIDLGDNLIPPEPGVNDRGFWEDSDIVKLNDKMLFALASSWHHFLPLSNEQVASLINSGYLDEAQKLLQEKFLRSNIFGIKDPRLPRLLPLWKRIFENLELNVSYIIPLRHPLEVAQSLSRRDGFSLEQGLLMWIDHMIAALVETQGTERILASYDELLEYPDFTLGKIAEFLGLRIDHQELIQFKEGFLDKGLRHHHFSDDNFVLLGLNDCKFLNRLLSFYQELQKSLLNQNYLDIVSIKAFEYQAIMKEYQIVWNFVNKQQTELFELNTKISGLRQMLADRDVQISRLQQSVADLDLQISQIYNSKAWKLVTILRWLRRKIAPPNSYLARLGRVVWSIMRKIGYLYRRIFDVWREKGFVGILTKSIRRFKLEIDKIIFPLKYRFLKWFKFSWSRSPSVSVVIPIYDRTDVLIESIESILKQTYQNFELLLVCDGSPDETLEVVQRYAAEYPEKIRAFYFKNNSGNAVRGRNKAIKEARGEYLAFQDSDDIAEPHRLEYSVKAIQEFQADVVYGGWRALVDGTRKDIDLQNGQEFFSPDADLELLKKVCVPCQSTVMAKISALRDVGGLSDQMRYREDHELWLRLAYRGYKFKSIPAVLTNLRLHRGNLEITLKEDDAYWENRMLEEYTRPRRLKPKIGYIVPGDGIGGGLIVVLEHANRLLKRGYDVTIISENNQTDFSWYPDQMVNVVPLKNVETNYDILVATGWSTAYPVMEMPAGRKFYLVQSDERRFFAPGDRQIIKAEQTYRMNFEFLTIARWMQKWLKEEFGKDAVYVPNAIDENIVHRTAPIEPKGQKLRVLLEGPINIPFKGMEDAFRAVDGVDCEVWCVSSFGKPRPGWKCDRFFERVPWQQMKYIYSSCDVLLKMSRVESFSLPPLEMMACGGTAVVSEVTGIEEYIQHEYNALVVRQRDVVGAREALIRLAEDRNLLRFLSANGEQTAQKFRWDPSIDVLEKTFHPPIE